MLRLIEQAKQHSNRKAIISNEQTYSYQSLLVSSQNLAAHLLNGKTDLEEARIAYIVPPSFEYTATQWGIWQAGGIAVPLCVLHPLPSLRYVLEDTKADTLIVHTEYEDFLTPLANELNIRLLRLSDILKDKTALLPNIEISRRAMILYTSGTTSLPKGVVTTHANIESQIKTLVDAWEWQADDHILEILPLHHVHGIINVMSCALWSGACCEFLPKFNAQQVFDIIQKGELNLFMVVPTIYYKLINHYENLPKSEQTNISKQLRQFRLMVSGSAALPVSVLEKWRTISGQTLLERYGMTEIGMAVSNSYRHERRPGHIGLPLPNVELRLVDEHTFEPVEAGTAGEIQIKGPNVFLEYWNKPKKTKEGFTDDGWFKTGDIAVFNNGSYRILGRNSVDIIKSGGYKISALEIEEVLRQHPNVKECAVVGIPNEEWGETIAAGIVTDTDNLDFKQVSAWLKERIPAYRIPRNYMIIEDLPRNTLGKVTKKALQKMFIDSFE